MLTFYTNLKHLQEGREINEKKFISLVSLHHSILVMYRLLLRLKLKLGWVAAQCYKLDLRIPPNKGFSSLTMSLTSSTSGNLSRVPSAAIDSLEEKSLVATLLISDSVICSIKIINSSSCLLKIINIE